MKVTRITASSAQGPSVGYTFVAANLLDGAVETSWQPAKNDRGPHWVRLELDEEVTITSISIANGFQTKDRYGDEFLMNRKIASGRLRFGDGTEVAIRFAADARGLVRFPIERKRTRTVELLVDETHEGTKWKDLAVSEIQLTGISRAKESVAARAPEQPSTEWWTPPAGDAQDIQALAYGFAGIDENDLGVLFTGDFKKIRGAPNLFEQKPPRRVARDEMRRFVVKLRESSQLDAGFRYLFVDMGSSYNSTRDYQVLRAMQVSEVVRLDDTARMRRPPEEAVFYLAEVHRGASFDLLVDGESTAMGARLDLAFANTEGGLKELRESSSYRLKAFGLGLRDVSGEGIFAMTPDQIARSYRTGPAVPVQLVFRTVPGRVYRPKPLPFPELVIDEPMFTLSESAGKNWSVRPGKYWIEATSKPNGMHLSWNGAVTCDKKLDDTKEYGSIKMNCTVRADAELTLKNPSWLNTGPAEQMSLYLSRQP